MASEILLRKRQEINYKDPEVSIPKKIAKRNNKSVSKQNINIIPPNHRDKVVTQDGRVFYPCQYCSRAFVEKARRAIHLNSCSAKAYILSVGEKDKVSQVESEKNVNQDNSFLTNKRSNQKHLSVHKIKDNNADAQKIDSAVNPKHGDGDKDSQITSQKAIEPSLLKNQMCVQKLSLVPEIKSNDDDQEINTTVSVESIANRISLSDIVSPKLNNNNITDVLKTYNVDNTQPKTKIIQQKFTQEQKSENLFAENANTVLQNVTASKNLVQQKLKTISEQTVIKNATNNTESVIFKKLLLLKSPIASEGTKSNIKSTAQEAIKQKLYAKPPMRENNLMTATAKISLLHTKSTDRNKIQQNHNENISAKSKSIKKPKAPSKNKIKENLQAFNTSNESVISSQKLPLMQLNSCNSVTVSKLKIKKNKNQKQRLKIKPPIRKKNTMDQVLDVTPLQKELDYSFNTFKNDGQIEEKFAKKSNKKNSKKKIISGVPRQIAKKKTKLTPKKTKENSVSLKKKSQSINLDGNCVSISVVENDDKSKSLFGSSTITGVSSIPTTPILFSAIEEAEEINNKKSIPKAAVKKISNKKNEKKLKVNAKNTNNAISKQHDKKSTKKIIKSDNRFLEIQQDNTSPLKMIIKNTTAISNYQDIKLTNDFMNNDTNKKEDKEKANKKFAKKLKRKNVNEGVAVSKNKYLKTVTQKQTSKSKNYKNIFTKPKKKVSKSIPNGAKINVNNCDINKMTALDDMFSSIVDDVFIEEETDLESQASCAFAAEEKLSGVQIGDAINSDSNFMKTSADKVKTSNEKLNSNVEINSKEVVGFSALLNKEKQSCVDIINEMRDKSQSKQLEDKIGKLENSASNCLLNIEQPDVKNCSKNKTKTKNTEPKLKKKNKTNNTQVTQSKVLVGKKKSEEKTTKKMIDITQNILLNTGDDKILPDGPQNQATHSRNCDKNCQVTNLSETNSVNNNLRKTNLHVSKIVKKNLQSKTMTSAITMCSNITEQVESNKVQDNRSNDNKTDTTSVKSCVDKAIQTNYVEKETEKSFNDSDDKFEELEDEEYDEEMDALVLEDDPVPSSATPSNSNKLHVCNYCQEGFLKQIDLLRHKRSAHKFPKILVSKTHLEKYYDVKDRSYCPICKKPMENRHQYRSYFIKHLLTHSDEMKFSCPKCKKKFRRQDHMKDHQKRHI